MVSVGCYCCDWTLLLLWFSLLVSFVGICCKFGVFWLFVGLMFGGLFIMFSMFDDLIGCFVLICVLCSLLNCLGG